MNKIRRKKMIAIIVETPYQLMNALNIVYSKYKGECMLFITKDMFMSNKKFIIETNNKYIKKVFYFRKEAKKNKYNWKAISKSSI